MHTMRHFLAHVRKNNEWITFDDLVTLGTLVKKEKRSTKTESTDMFIFLRHFFLLFFFCSVCLGCTFASILAVIDIDYKI